MSIRANYPNIRPSLNLDFANAKRLDPRITFSRASSATYVNASGVIQAAAANVPRFDHNPVTGESLGLLIEESRTNLATNSTSYVAWASVNSTSPASIDNQGIAPDGSNTAWLIPQTATSFNQKNYAIPANTSTYTWSVFVKALDPSAYVDFAVNGIIGVDFSNARFTFSTETFSAAKNGTVTKYANGWYRLTQTFANNGSGIIFVLRINSDPNYTNNKVLFWGAQVEQGSFATSYIPTPATFTSRSTTATYYNASGVVTTAAINEARSNAFLPDSNGVMRPAGLLLEAASTNLLNGSQTFATSGGTQNNWVDTNITRDGTLRTSPDGTANALRVTASSANATIVSSAAIGSSALRTFSIFLRRVTGTGDIQYTLDNGSTWTTQAITTSWSRYSFPATTADQQVGIRLVTSGDAIELWGAQLENSPYATSYIPTTTATVTRAADVSSSSTVTRSADVAQITGTNFSSWYNQSQGTILHTGRFIGDVEGNTYGRGNALIVYFRNSGLDSFTNQWSIGGLRNSGPSLPAWLDSVVYNGSTTQVLRDNIQLFNNPVGSLMKVGAYIDNASGLYGHCLNGNLVTNRSIANTPVWDRLSFSVAYNGDTRCGTISRFTYWPTRLTSTQLQTLTR